MSVSDEKKTYAADILDELRSGGRDVAGVVVIVVTEHGSDLRVSVADGFSKNLVLDSAQETIASIPRERWKIEVEIKGYGV